MDVIDAAPRFRREARMLGELRKTARPEEWLDLSSGYRLEIERMQREILDYLVAPGPETTRAKTA